MSQPQVTRLCQSTLTYLRYLKYLLNYNNHVHKNLRDNEELWKLGDRESQYLGYKVHTRKAAKM